MHLVVGRGARAVANNLEATDHLANSEETENLSEDDTGSKHLGAGNVPYSAQDRRRLCGVGRLVEECAGVAERLEERLIVALEGGSVAYQGQYEIAAIKEW